MHKKNLKNGKKRRHILKNKIRIKIHIKFIILFNVHMCFDVVCTSRFSFSRQDLLPIFIIWFRLACVKMYDLNFDHVDDIKDGFFSPTN